MCDSGERYVSKMFNDAWMEDQGFIPRVSKGDLRDLISRPHESHSTILVGPGEMLRSAHTRMKMFDVSQLPVVDEGKVVGLLDETDLLLALTQDPGALERPVSDFMTTHLEVFAPSESLSSVVKLLNKGLTAIIADDSEFYGIVTRIDVIDYLRRKTS